MQSLFRALGSCEKALKPIFSQLLTVAFAAACICYPARAAEAMASLSPLLPQAQAPEAGARELFVNVGKSVVIDSPVNIERVSVANGELAEAVVVNPREVLVNGKAAGETSLIVWQTGGNRLFFDLHVRPNPARLDAVRQEMTRQLAGQSITLEHDSASNAVFLSGTVNDLNSAERAVAIAATMGKVVNLLQVRVPPAESQILLKVKFANVDRAAVSELGANYFSTGAGNTIGSVSTQQFGPPRTTGVNGKDATFTLTDLLNVFVVRPDLNLGITIKALASRRLLEILAEPNVLAINGQPASFLAGGEFPYPTLQGGGGGLGAVTIQFREFGVRINFVPTVTPRGTIRLQVTPEVSSLDFANGLVFQGFTIPALNTRRVQTAVELENGQSFAIGGLLDNRAIESLSKIPGIGDIPWLGKLFQSRTLQRNKTELLVLVTPELVRPIPAGQPLPEIQFPKEFMKEGGKVAPRTPGMESTGPVPVKPPQETIPVEQLIQSQKAAGQPAAPALPPIQLVPIPMAPAPGPAAPPGQQLVPQPPPPGTSPAAAQPAPAAKNG